MTTTLTCVDDAVRALVKLALEEDVGAGDITSQAVIPVNLGVLEAELEAREPGVLAGMPVVSAVYAEVDARVRVEAALAEGAAFSRGSVLGRVRGPARSLLAGERAALNFLQRLSGVATLTRAYVDAVGGLPVEVMDTRKTTPGYRSLEKYAVRMGGGTNHRMGLFDQILIKDNHVLLLERSTGRPVDLRALLEDVRRKVGRDVRIEIEVQRTDQLEAVLEGKPDIVLLDNLSPEEIVSAVRIIRARGQEPLIEASGGVNLDNVRTLAGAGIDRISVGRLTHSARALDIALEVR